MKSIRSFLIGTVISGSLAASLHFLHAQTAVAGGFNNDIAPIQSVPDSIVQITADAQGLALVQPDQAPRSGTFWLFMPGYGGGIAAPMPCPPLDSSLPIYAIANGQFLVDGTVSGQAALNTPRAGRLTSASSTGETALEAQANAVVNLIARVQTTAANEQMRAMGMDVPGFGDGGDGGGGTNGFYSNSFNYVILTNGLWLEITNVANGLAYVNLRHATNKVYEVWSKMDLAATNWNIEQEVWPTNTTVMPFRVPQLNRPNLFLWARDWTGITSHGNTAPEWWFWKYFGTVDLLDTNLDNQGNTFRYDYTNGLDPNVITFSLQFTNTDLNSSPANGTVTIQGGAPSYIAVLVNDTNQADASWQPYSSTNIVVPLNSGNGLYNVQVGLRGLPSDARQSWVSAQLTLDNVAPRFVVTSPTNSTVSVPMIQLQGYVSASLSSLTYDVSNAAGIFTNQQGYWQPAFYNTNLLAFTTNSFQCYDVTLTNGLNRITLHATDVAGNSTTTNFSYTLDYSGDHTAPLLAVIWPTNGTSIAGSNFTVQAQMDDTTATVTATINSNIVAGLVERSGAVWFNNLPLNSGTNTVTITATDAAGNMSTTNLTVVQSFVSLTINPISSDQLNQTNVTVSGTIGDASEKVTVNGVSETVSGTNWTATNVPVSPTGTAGLNAQVTDSGNNPLAAQNVYQPQPAQVVLASYKSQINDTYQTIVFVPPLNRSFYNLGIETTGIYWSYGTGGVWHFHDIPYDTEVGPSDYFTVLPAGENGLSALWENVDTQSHFEGSDVAPPSYPEQISSSSYNHTQTHVMIQPSGQQPVGQSMLYLVQAQVTNEDTGLQLLAGAVQFMNQLAGTTTEDVTNSDGSVWSEGLVSAPAGAQVEVTPQAAGNYSFTGMKLSKLVYISVDSNNKPSTFDAHIVQTTFQSELFSKVFYSLPAGESVHIMVHVGSYGGIIGWNSSKQTYVNRVVWNQVFAGGLAASPAGDGNTTIDPIACRNYNAGSDPGTQFWVNVLAHETIWLNICGGVDHDLTPPAGEISSGLEPPLTTQFTVSPANQAHIISKFGF